jgi:hypothetical protein
MSQARRALVVLVSALGFLFGVAPAAVAQSRAHAVPGSSVSRAGGASSSGYWVVARDGGVFSGGGAVFRGSTGAIALNQPIVGMAATPSGDGYWMVASDGGIFSFGDAVFYGSTGAITLNRPIVGMAATPTGHGYWMVAADGGIFSFGDAAFHGSTGAITLNRPIVGMASTPTGHGYWLVARDGGLFSFGDAAFHGSTGAIVLNQPIAGMASTQSGHGYYMVASDGGIFSFGDATFFGSTGAIVLNQPIVGMALTPSGHGYWFVAADGGVFSFGDARFFGSRGASTLNQPVVGMSASAAKPASPPPRSASQLSVTVNPSPTTGGVAFPTQPQVAVQDAAGAIVMTAMNPVTLSIAFPPAGVTLTCNNNPAIPVDGVAVFSGCAINTAGTYTLRAESGSLTPSSTSATITVGPAVQIGFTTEPVANGTNGALFTVNPVATVEDAGGNTVSVPTAMDLSVTGAPAGSSISCTNNHVVASAGVAAYDLCALTGPEATYTLTATDTASVTGFSSSVVVSAAGAATHMLFTSAPVLTGVNGATFTNSPAATVKDVSNNTVTAATSVTLSITGTPANTSLTCTSTLTVVATAGVASFTGCALTGPEATYTLHALDTAAIAGNSGNVVINASSAATQIVYTVLPVSGVASTTNWPTSPTVTVEDVSGNTVTTPNSITLTLSAGATLACTGGNTLATAAGLAVFTGCNITGTAGPYVLTADQGTVPTITTAVTVT